MVIRLAILDGEGIIYNCDKTMEIFLKEYEKFVKKFGVNLRFQEKLWFKLYPKIVRGKLKLKEADELIYQKIGIPKSKVKEWLKKDKEILLKYTKVYKDVKKLIEELKKKGIKVAVLSDTVHPLKWRIELFKKLGIEKGKHYDKIFLSNQIGAEKPEPKAYLTVLNYFKVKPEAALFIGHDKEELEGAKRVGMKILELKKERKNMSFKKLFNLMQQKNIHV